MLSEVEREYLLRTDSPYPYQEVGRTPKYRPFRATEDVPGLHAGSKVRSLYTTGWYGVVETLFVYPNTPDHILAIVRRVCTRDGRPYRDTGLAALTTLDPTWLEPVSSFPFRTGAWPA